MGSPLLFDARCHLGLARERGFVRQVEVGRKRRLTGANPQQASEHRPVAFHEFCIDTGLIYFPQIPG